MAKPGAKPQSAQLLLLKGSYGNHRERLGKREESPPISAEAPGYLKLTAAERTLWRNLVKAWWWLPECTEPAMGELCKLMAQSNRLKREHDHAMKTCDIYAVRILGQALRAVRNDVRQYLIEFGMTPAERNRFLREGGESVPKTGGGKSLID